MMDLRFNILNPYVDKFVVCEARFSHSGKEKNINFNKKDYPKFEDKIIHLVLDNDPVEKDINSQKNPYWLRQSSIDRIEAQRNYISKALNEADQNDYIIYSDNDEIPNLSKVDFKKINENLIFKQNCIINLTAYPRVDWFGTKACKLKDLKNISWLRNIKNKNIIFLD